MTIYTQFYAPIEITAAFDMGGGLYFIKAKLIGHYQDGSGVIGEQLFADDATAQGWFPNIELKATDGIREINDACAAAPQEKPTHLVDLFQYYGITWFNLPWTTCTPSGWEEVARHLEKSAKKYGRNDIWEMAATAWENASKASSCQRYPETVIKRSG